MIRAWAWRIAKWGLLLFSGTFLVLLILNLWVVWRSSGLIYESVSELPPCDVALVLGTSRNPFFYSRMRSAAELYKSGKVKKLLISGDNGTDHYNEISAMRKELVRLGVSGKDIVNDHAGFRTFDSVLRAKSVFGQQSLIIVSQRFHVQRAIFIARSQGIKAVGLAAKDPSYYHSLHPVMLREYFARVKAWLDCYLLGTKPKFPGPPEPIVLD